MSEVTDWLPADTPVPGELDALLAETIAGWGEAWFRATRSTMPPLSRRTCGDVTWQSLEKGPMLGLVADGVMAIGGAVLDLAKAERSDVDRAVLESVGEDCLADLRQRLAVMAGQPRHAEWTPSFAPPTYVATLAFRNSQIVAIGFSGEVFAHLAKHVLPAAPETPLGNGAAALAAAPIDVGASLGRVRLTVGELEALAIGDIVVLDHGVDTPIRLAVGGVRMTAGTCSIATAAPVPFLQIIEPVA